MMPQERREVIKAINLSKPHNCPNCGRFLKWDSETLKFSCVCGKVKTTVGNGHILIESPQDYTEVRK